MKKSVLILLFILAFNLTGATTFAGKKEDREAKEAQEQLEEEQAKAEEEAKKAEEEAKKAEEEAQKAEEEASTEESTSNSSGDSNASRNILLAIMTSLISGMVAMPIRNWYMKKTNLNFRIEELKLQGEPGNAVFVIKGLIYNNSLTNEHIDYADLFITTRNKTIDITKFTVGNLVQNHSFPFTVESETITDTNAWNENEAEVKVDFEKQNKKIFSKKVRVVIYKEARISAQSANAQNSLSENIKSKALNAVSETAN